VSRDFEAGSSDYLETSTVFAGNTFCWAFACWIKCETLPGTAMTIMSVATSGSGDNYFKLDVTAGNQIRFRARTTGSSDAIPTGTLSTGVWYFVACRAISATDRAAWFGSTKGTNTTSRNPSGMNRISLGRSSESSGTTYFDGLIAYPTYWEGATSADVPSDADMTAMAGGAWPGNYEASNITDLFLLDGSSPEVGSPGGNTFTVTGAVYSTDEPFAAPGGGYVPRMGLLGVG
jgi:hypothetical protein